MGVCDAPEREKRAHSGHCCTELVTGRRAFQGDSNISTLAAIIEREPKPMARVERPARKMASEGRRPQFSPDGEWIAYGVGWSSNGVLLSGRNECRIYIVPAGGGTPRQLRTDFAGAAFPVWTPDGKHLLFLGNRDEKLPANENIDWWVTPLDTGPAVKTGALDATRTERLSSSIQAAPSALVPSAWETGGDSIVFSARSGDSTNLWRIASHGTRGRSPGRRSDSRGV